MSTQPKPATPTHDAETALAVRQLSGYVVQLTGRLDSLEAELVRSRRTRSLGVAVGTFFGALAVAVLGGAALVLLGVISAGTL